MFFVGPWDGGKLVGLLYRPPMEFVKCGNWLRTSSMEWMLVVAYGISGVDVCGFRVLWAAGALGGRFFFFLAFVCCVGCWGCWFVLDRLAVSGCVVLVVLNRC